MKVEVLKTIKGSGGVYPVGKIFTSPNIPLEIMEELEGDRGLVRVLEGDTLLHEIRPENIVAEGIPVVLEAPVQPVPPKELPKTRSHHKKTSRIAR